MVESGLLGETQGVHQVGQEAVPVPGRGLVQYIPGNSKKINLQHKKKPFGWTVSLAGAKLCNMYACPCHVLICGLPTKNGKLRGCVFLCHRHEVA